MLDLSRAKAFYESVFEHAPTEVRVPPARGRLTRGPGGGQPSSIPYSRAQFSRLVRVGAASR